MIGHIIERNLTHLFWDPGFVLGLTFVIRLIARKTKWRWMPRTPILTVIYAGVLTIPATLAREPWDIHAGGWWGKSYFDIGSHLVYIPLGCWALYRLIMWGIESAEKKGTE